jgi:hypothetical protein
MFFLVFISIYKPHPKCKNLYLLFFLLAYISSLNHNLKVGRKKLFFGKAISYLDRFMVLSTATFIFICFKKYLIIYLFLLYTIIIYFFIVPKINSNNPFLKSLVHSTIHINFINTVSYLYYSF